MAAAISGSASVSVAVKNESGAEWVYQLARFNPITKPKNRVRP